MTRQFEPTEVGAQSLIDGVRPVTLGEKLTARLVRPHFKPKIGGSHEQTIRLKIYSLLSIAHI